MIIDDAGYGYDPTVEEDIPVTSPHFVDVLPSKFNVNSSFLPPIGQQGTTESPGFPGSCAAWATTYGLATFTAARRGLVLDPSQPPGQASPAYLYIQVQICLKATKNMCAGSNFKPYFEALNAHGAPTMETAPYFANCTQLWTDYANASPTMDARFKLGKSKVWAVSTEKLDDVKQVLASNRALAYGTGLYTDWSDYRGDPVPYVGNGIKEINKKTGTPAGHCMLIIGYDDDIDGGAVLIQNSEGTAWGADGYVQMAYKTFQDLAQGQAFYVDDKQI